MAKRKLRKSIPGQTEKQRLKVNHTLEKKEEENHTSETAKDGKSFSRKENAHSVIASKMIDRA